MANALSVYISVDLEGVAGVVHRDQTLPGGKDYDLARKWATEEVNAALRGARAGGATRFLVNDAHLDMRNLLFDGLDDRGDLMVVAGDVKPLGMMEGIDGSFSGSFLLGYHAMVGTRGAVVDHSYYSSGTIQNVRLNGKTVGETVLSAALAGCFGVPVILVTGDGCVCSEAEEALPGVRTVCVKTGISRGAARTATPGRARQLIERAARESVHALAAGASPPPLGMEPPVVLEVDLAYTSMADVAEMVPGVERVSGRTVRYVSDDYLKAFKAFRTLIVLSMHAK